MDGWNTIFPLGRPRFRCVLVSFREGRITINRFLLHVRDLKGDTFKTFRHTSYGEKTPPKTNKCPLKINGWKMYFLLKWHLSRGHVSFRVCIHQSYLRLWHGKSIRKVGPILLGTPLVVEKHAVQVFCALLKEARNDPFLGWIIRSWFDWNLAFVRWYYPSIFYSFIYYKNTYIYIYLYT